MDGSRCARPRIRDFATVMAAASMRRQAVSSINRNILLNGVALSVAVHSRRISSSSGYGRGHVRWLWSAAFREQQVI